MLQSTSQDHTATGVSEIPVLQSMGLVSQITTSQSPIASVSGTDAQQDPD